MNQVSSTSLVLLLLCAPLAGQDPTKQRIEREVREMRQKMQEGQVLQTNVRVTVRLKNGNRLIGVVRNGRVIEKPDGLDFVEATTKTEGAGIRIWYFDRTNSTIFVPFEAIESYRIGQRLSEAQVREMEQLAEKERLESEKGRGAQLGQRKSLEDARQREQASARKLDELAQKLDKQEIELAEDQAMLALLTEFPADQGWGAERIKEIHRRKVSVGAFPSEKERRFIEVFESWQKALALKQKLDAQASKTSGAQPAPAPAPSGETKPVKPSKPEAKPPEPAPSEEPEPGVQEPPPPPKGKGDG